MKIMTVVGARPQFIKEAVVSEQIRKEHKEVLVHTGQHFDYNMSKRFFEELNIPEPDYNLGISGGSHAEMTSRMLVELEKVMKNEMPDWVCVYGDTNSTLAAALVAAKLHIPICHIEAGIRTHSITNPEEINRVCTDHISTLLLASSESSMIEMEKEGLSSRGVFVGDPMYDAFEMYKDRLQLSDVSLKLFNGEEVCAPDRYYYLTCHREENTSDRNLVEILNAMNQLDGKVIYPVHPRNLNRIARLSQNKRYDNIIFSKPVSYLESICLVNNAIKIVTDSGGLQREAFFAGKQCITILDFVTWPETMVSNRNILSKADENEILDRLSINQSIDLNYKPFGDGNAAKKIVNAINMA